MLHIRLEALLKARGIPERALAIVKGSSDACAGLNRFAAQVRLDELCEQAANTRVRTGCGAGVVAGRDAEGVYLSIDPSWTVNCGAEVLALMLANEAGRAMTLTRWRVVRRVVG